VTDVVKTTETGLKIMDAEELSIGDKIAEKTLVELSVAIPVRTMIGGPGRTRTCNQTVMSGGPWREIRAKSAFLDPPSG
jgi:hypothetical protein